MHDGRYDAGNDRLAIDLRVDAAVCGVISADVFRRVGDDVDYVASLRTPPGERIRAADGMCALGAQDELGATAGGRLTLVGDEDDPAAVHGTFRIDGTLNGLPARSDVTFEARWRSAALREVGVEVELEAGVEPIAPLAGADGEITFESCLAAAGIEVRRTGRTDVVPAAARPWVTGDLHALMTSLAQAQPDRRAWQLQLLALSRATHPPRLGVV